jgi:phenylacetate-CoA ligase
VPIHNPRYEQLDPDAVRALQTERLRDVLAAALETNPFYREHWRRAGADVTRVDSLEALAALVPTVEKADFLADQREHPPWGERLAHAVSLREPLQVYTTSGTSGQGVEVHAQTPRELASMIEMYGYMFRWAGLEPGDLALLTLPLTMLGGGRIEWEGAVGYGLTVLPAGSYDAVRKLELLRQFRPKALYGSTSYFGHLAAIADTQPPCDSLEVLLTGLEGVGFSYLENLAASWQATVADRFGCTQLRSDFMFTCEHGIGSADRPGLLHNLDPFMITEVIDPETGRHVADGEFGELVVTSLYHLDNPVVRCRLRDGAIWHGPGYCPCGRPFGGVEVASVTRTDDVHKVKGVLVFPQAVDDLVFSFSEVDEYEVVLTSDAALSDVITLRVMTRTEVSEGFGAEVARALHRKIGLHSEIVLATDVPRSTYKARRWRDERVR